MIAKNCETCARSFDYEGRAYCDLVKIKNRNQFPRYYTCDYAWKYYDLCDRGKHWVVRIKEMNNDR